MIPKGIQPPAMLWAVGRADLTAGKGRPQPQGRDMGKTQVCAGEAHGLGGRETSAPRRALNMLETMTDAGELGRRP